MSIDNLQIKDETSFFYYKELVVLIIFIQNLLNCYIDWRQVKRWRNSNLVKLEIEYLEMTESQYIDHKLNLSDQLAFKIITSFISNTLECTLIYYEFGPFTWKNSVYFIEFIGLNKESEYLRGLFCLGCDFIREKTVSFMSECYENFFIKFKNNSNKKTLKQLIEEEIFLIGSSFVMSIIALKLYLWLIYKFRSYFFTLYDIIFITLAITLIFIYRYVLTMLPPLSQKFSEPGKNNRHLMKKVTNICLKLKFPLDKVYNIDDSHRTYLTRPYFFGIKTKSIVIFENILKKLNDEEMEAIICQVVSFFFLGHIYIYMLFVIIHFIVIYYIFAFFITSEVLLKSFGYQDYSVFLGSNLFLIFYSNFTFITSTVYIMINRFFEKKSDQFSVDHKYGKQLISGIIKANKENINNIDLDPWYECYNLHYGSIEHLKIMQEEFNLKNK